MGDVVYKGQQELQQLCFQNVRPAELKNVTQYYLPCYEQYLFAQQYVHPVQWPGRPVNTTG